MSTIDPAIARRERESRRPSPVVLGIVLAILLLAGLAVGYGWASFAAISDTFEPDAAIIVPAIAGLIVLIAASIAWAAMSLRRSDVGTMLGNAVALAGATVGILLAVSSYVDGTGAMIAAVATGVLAIAATALTITATLRRRAAAARDAEAIRSGILVTATVSDRGFTIFRESERIFTTVTFAFTDLDRTQRWVQRPMVVHASNPIQNGQSTRLWFDGANPGDDRRIVVELARDNPLKPVAAPGGVTS